MFAGGLTPTGFVDFFKYIMPLENAKKRYFLKGSSGSGKSTFIKKIAAEFAAANVAIDLFHCANDASSLDGMAIKDFGFCIFDATMPHAHDPELPAGVDEIIDFAQFLDGQKVRKHIDEIKTLLGSKKLLSKKAYTFLSTAGNIYSAEKKAYETALITPRVQEWTRNCFNIFDKADSSNPDIGTNRKLFLSAVTPDGMVHFADNILSPYKIYCFCAKMGVGIDSVLVGLKDYANACGIDTESFYSPLEPTKLEYLLLPKEGLAFASSGGRYGYMGKGDEVIDLVHCFYPNRLQNAELDMLQNGEIIDSLLKAATASMKASRAAHSKIEEIYISAMDFDKVNALTRQMIGELLMELSQANA